MQSLATRIDSAKKKNLIFGLRMAATIIENRPPQNLGKGMLLFEFEITRVEEFEFLGIQTLGAKVINHFAQALESKGFGAEDFFARIGQELIWIGGLKAFF